MRRNPERLGRDRSVALARIATFVRKTATDFQCSKRELGNIQVLLVIERPRLVVRRSAGAARMSRLAPKAWSRLAIAFQALTRHADAAGAFRKALELKSELAAAQYGLGRSLMELQRIDEAETLDL